MDGIVMKRQFRIRPYDPNRPRKPATEAQERQRARAWRIARLRSLWTLCYVLSPANRMAVQAIIDLDLKAEGAEPHGERHRRETDELYARLEAEAEADDTIPF